MLDSIMIMVGSVLSIKMLNSSIIMIDFTSSMKHARFKYKYALLYVKHEKYAWIKHI